MSQKKNQLDHYSHDHIIRIHDIRNFVSKYKIVFLNLKCLHITDIFLHGKYEVCMYCDIAQTAQNNTDIMRTILW